MTDMTALKTKTNELKKTKNTPSAKHFATTDCLDTTTADAKRAKCH